MNLLLNEALAPESVDDQGAALPMYLLLRGGVYYFKRKYPADVARSMRVKQVWKSLCTSDRACATRSLATELSAFDAKVENERRKTQRSSTGIRTSLPRPQGTTKYLLAEHIPNLLERFAYFHFETDDEERRAMSREERAQRHAEFEEGLEHLYDQAAAEDYESMEEVATMLLHNERLVAPPGSKVRTMLLKALLRKDIEVLKEQCDRLKGKGTLSPDALPVPPRCLPTLLDLVSSWQKTQSRSRTIDTYQGFVADFESRFGALPVTAITAHHADEFRDLLADSGLMRETIGNRLGGLATLVEHGVKHRLCATASNPFRGVALDMIPDRPASEDRRAYEVSEMTTVFRSPLYTTQDHRSTGQAKEAGYWAPLMGPFIGARIEEIAQLRLEDVQCINGVWTLRICDLDEAQNLKTPTSYRFVPIHEELVRVGFLKYAAEQKRAGHERLFPSLRNDNRNRTWSNALGKWFLAYLRRIGVADPRVCYHSFRYMFKQQCALSGISTEVRDALSGHWVSKGDSGRGYMKAAERQYPFPVLAKAVQELAYQELDLTHLYVADEPPRVS